MMIDAAALSPLQAHELLLSFAARCGETALRLALHAAVPQVLRHDLLHLLRLNFVPESLSDAAIEADVLFAPFCEDIGNGYFRFAENARLLLLRDLDPICTDEATPRSMRIAGFLAAWIEQQSRSVGADYDALYAEYLEVERWSALGFLDPDAAAMQLAGALERVTAAGEVMARVRIAGLASALATPLRRHGRLLAYAAGVEAAQAGDAGRARDLLEPLGKDELLIGTVRLKPAREVLQAFVSKSEPEIEQAEQLPGNAEAVQDEQAREFLHIRITHAKLEDEDIAFVDRLASDLQTIGHRIVSPGEDRFREKLAQADYLLVVLRLDTESRHWVRQELAFAESRGIRRIDLLRQGDLNVTPTEESGASVVDFREPRPYHEAFEELQAKLRRQPSAEAASLNDLAALYSEQGQYGKAEPFYRRALAIDEKSHGLEHPNVAKDLNNLALLLLATNRLGEAEPLIKRALLIDEKSYGPEHPNIARDLSTLAQLLQATNRPGEAEPLIKRALAIDEKSYGPEHSNVARDLSTLAQLLQATNRLEEAEPLIKRALAIDEKSYGPEHPNVARDLSTLALLLFAMKRVGDAELLMKRALALGSEQREEDVFAQIPEEIPPGVVYVYISYSPEDIEAVGRLLRGLRCIQVPVWLDKHRLEAGEDYERSLFAVKEGCSFFLSIVSRATEANPERFVHQERHWAAQRHVEGFVFYLPVIIDETTQLTREPAEFAKIHFERLSGGNVTAAFAMRLRQLVEECRLTGRPRA